MHNIEDIIEFNSQHADQELPESKCALAPSPNRNGTKQTMCLVSPDQSKLIDASRHRPSKELYEWALHHMSVVTRERGIDKVFKESNLNLLAMPMDSSIPAIAAAAGKIFSAQQCAHLF